MILIDTPVWIDGFHKADGDLTHLLVTGRALTHPLVIAELALGSLKDRRRILDDLNDLPRVLRASDEELRRFIDANSLWSRGLSAVDASLLASALVTPGARLWTRDKRLAATAAELGIAWAPS